MFTLPLLRVDAGDRPRPSVNFVRQLARLGTLVRWPGLLMAGIVGLVVPPRAPVLLVVLLVCVSIYNGWAMINIPRISDDSILRTGRALTLLDTVAYFVLLAIFTGVPPSSIYAIYAVYLLLIVWMVAYDGAEGAMLAVAIFVVGMISLQAVHATFFHLPFNAVEVLLWSLIMAVAGAIIAAFDRILLTNMVWVRGPEGHVYLASSAAPGGSVAQSPAPADPQTAEHPPAASVVSVSSAQPAVRLSPREQEVLRLVAEGCSNSMIASRLHLSENTIKTYMETLLTRLNARNRAEAVATASRQNLI
jgi:DNA-binding CsgD family transcriptional regulator